MSHLLQPSIFVVTLVLNRLRILELGESDFHCADKMSEIIKKKKDFFWAHSFKDSSPWLLEPDSSGLQCMVTGENGRGHLFFP